MSATASLPIAVSRPSPALHVGLWAAQVLLAIAFGMAGYLKLATPIAELAHTMEWTASAPALVRFIGAAELAGAVGILLPALTRIQPRLTALAALGLATVMVLATGFHVVRGELSVIVVPIALGALATFVAWGRSRRAPIAPR